ncbi:hypothetical protein ACFXGR_32210 [Streptomyces mirabilis]|uniref:hypothetical protein n=1 Tax=Streptomyces mirabilis TaxID=68239 RepID=UPI00368823A7
MEPAAELPTEGTHAHGVTETGDLGTAGLDAVAQLTRLGQVPEELGAAPSALGVRLRLPGPFGPIGLFGPFGLFALFDAAKWSGPFGPIGPFGRIGSSESVQLLRGLLFPVRHRHTTPGPSLPPSL